MQPGERPYNKEGVTNRCEGSLIRCEATPNPAASTSGIGSDDQGSLLPVTVLILRNMGTGKNDEGADLQGGQALATKTRRKAKRPRLYKVLLHNDDYTTMEFVVMVLIDVFHRTESEAVRIMLHVHQRGIGVAGVYPRQVAETRVAKVSRLARAHDFPLLCTMEPA